VDKKFFKFEYCLLRPANRTLKYFFVKVNLYKTPVTDVPTTYVNIFMKHLLNKLLKYPFKHDLMADRVSTEVGNHRMTNILPFPERKHMNKMN